jgi:hypothetical protein
MTLGTFHSNVKNFDEVRRALSRIGKEILKHNLRANLDEPDNTDDITKGYEIGSLWIDTTGLGIFICINNAEGAANWREFETLPVDGTPFTADVYEIAVLNDDWGERAGQTTTLTTTTTIDAEFEIYLVNAASGAVTVNLPTASQSEDQKYFIKKIDSSGNIVTVDPDGSETIDDQTTQLLSNQYDSIEIVSDGSEWWIV